MKYSQDIGDKALASFAENVEFSSMKSLTGEQLRDIQRYLGAIAEILASVEAEEFDVSAEVQAMVSAKVAERLCLSCDQAIPRGEQVKRGNCITCYGTNQARMTRGLTTEKALVESGMLTASKAKPGRPARMDRAKSKIVSNVKGVIEDGDK